MNIFTLASRKALLVIGTTIVALSLLATAAFGATITAKGNGNWNSTTNNAPWVGGVPPTSADIAIICNGANVTVNVSNAAAASVTLGKNANPNMGAGTLTFASGSHLTVGGTVHLGVTGGTPQIGTVVMTAGGTLTAQTLANDNSGVFTAGTGTVELTASGTLPFTSLNNLTITSGTTTMSGVTTCSGALNLNGGILTGVKVSAASATGGSATSYVNCTLSMNISSSTTYPVGNSGLAAVTINPTASAIWEVSSSAGAPSGVVNNGDVLQRTYMVNTTSGTADITFGYQDADVPGTATEGSWVVGQNMSGQYNPVGGSDNAGANTVTITGLSVTGAQQFTAGGDAALPIQMRSFTANAVSQNVTVSWTTVTEKSNMGFIVQRRSEGSSNYTSVSSLIAGAGNSMVEHSYSFTDKNVATGTYYYRLKQIDNTGGFTLSSDIKVKVDGALAVNDPANKAYSFKLGQNYPNPFNPSTKIAYEIPVQGIVTMKVYNVIGQEVATLLNGAEVNAGAHDVTFDASQLGSGVYFYHITVKGAQNFEAFNKMTLIK